MLGRVLRVGLLTTLTGCGTGLVYTHVTTPLDLDFNNTPVVRAGAGGVVEAQNGGLMTVRHADREILAILGLVYYRQTTIVYGD